MAYNFARAGTSSQRTDGTARTINRTRITAFLRGCWVLLLLGAVAFIAYGLFYAPGLYLDDWAQGTERLVMGHAHWLDFTNLSLIHI